MEMKDSLMAIKKSMFELNGLIDLIDADKPFPYGALRDAIEDAPVSEEKRRMMVREYGTLDQDNSPFDKILALQLCGIAKSFVLQAKEELFNGPSEETINTMIAEYERNGYLN